MEAGVLEIPENEPIMTDWDITEMRVEHAGLKISHFALRKDSLKDLEPYLGHQGRKCHSRKQALEFQNF